MKNPSAALALIQQGQFAQDNGQIGQARAAFKRALEADPRSFDAAFMLATTYAEQNNLKMASNFFRRAVENDGSIAQGHFNLGYALQLQKMFLEAKAAYLEAIKAHPDYHQALHNLGVVHEELGDYDAALECLEKALALEPKAPESLYNKGSVLSKLGKLEDALEFLCAALELAPTHVAALNNRGLVYLDLNRFLNAADDFSKALILEPDDADLWFQKGLAAMRMRHPANAEEAFARAQKLNPDSVKILQNRANMLELLKRDEEALVLYEKIRKIAPDTSYIDGFIQSSRMHVCNWSRYSENAARLIQRVAAGQEGVGPHGSLMLPCTRQNQQMAARVWAKAMFKGVEPKPFDNKPAPSDGRIRIGYFSADFHTHPVSLLSARMLELHDRSRFEVFAFSLGAPTRDQMRLRIESAVDHFINVRELSDNEIVEKARSVGLDIALDMTGYTADNRASVFAMRVAPIQISFLGYSGTMSVDFIDYIIADPVLIPPEHQPDYSESIARLPDSYMPSDPTREISTRPMSRADNGLPENSFVFCGFNNPTKLNPAVFDVWMRILKAVPDSVIWLSPTGPKVMENLRREARARGVEPERLVFSRREALLADHLARHRLADLFLDTFPHNAHATANDALWSGLPLLTLIGEAYAGRVAASLLTATGMSELIMNTVDEYEKRAIEIATTPGKSAELKAKLAANLPESALFNAERYTRNIEKAFAHVFERHADGMPPETFDVK